MASIIARKCGQFGFSGLKNRVLGMTSIIGLKSGYIQQVATIISPATYRHREEKPAPWPYETKKFTVFDQLFDSTGARLDENSKVIVIDGNLAVGKTELAQKLAKNLQFHFVPAVTEHDLFYSDYYDVDLRWTNHAVPKSQHFYDMRAWLSDPHPEKGVGAKLQLQMYEERLYKYARGLHHLMSTGQGIIVERSPFSDQAFAEAMKACGFMSRKALKYYLEVKRQTIFDIWKPHVTIYLDAPTDYVMEKVKERNHPAEQGSKALTEKFITELDRAYKKSVLPDMKRHGEVLLYDATDLDEVDVIVEDIERLNLEWNPDNEKKFQQWHEHTAEDFLSYYRRYWGSEIELRKLFNLPLPWHVPEMMDSADTVNARKMVILNYDRTKYKKGYNPDEEGVLSVLLRP